MSKSHTENVPQGYDLSVRDAIRVPRCPACDSASCAYMISLVVLTILEHTFSNSSTRTWDSTCPGYAVVQRGAGQLDVALATGCHRPRST